MQRSLLSNESVEVLGRLLWPLFNINKFLTQFRSERSGKDIQSIVRRQSSAIVHSQAKYKQDKAAIGGSWH